MFKLYVIFIDPCCYDLEPIINIVMLLNDYGDDGKDDLVANAKASIA